MFEVWKNFKFKNVFALFKRVFYIEFLSLLIFQSNIPDIPTLLSNICFQFVSSEFRWLWLVAGNRYLQHDRVMEVYVLDDDGGLMVD